MSDKRVLIVGGVAGGASCAARLRRLDERAEIVVFERGGAASFANCGLPYYLGGVIAERDKLLVSTPERFRAMFNVDVRTRHEAVGIDRVNKTLEVKNLAGGGAQERYDILVLATGAAPLRPPLAGIDLPGVFSLRNLDDADTIHAWLERRRPSRAVVVGGGYIGLEMAENLHRLGAHVTLLEQCGQLMPQADAEMAAPLQEELRRQGVDLRLGTAAAAFEAGPDGTLAAVAGDGQRFPADVIVLALGVKPDVELARRAGLDLGPTGGIRVDEQMRTSDPNIFAVGDAVEVRDFITGRPALIPLAGPANRQGRIAADAICGRASRYRGSQGTAVVGVFDLTFAMTGATEKSLLAAGVAYEKSFTHASQHAAYYPGAERIALKLLFAPDDGRILGAQAVGRLGVEKRIDVIAAAIQLGATVFDLEELELAYAPQYGSAKDAANMAGFAAANILRGDVRLAHWSEWLKLRDAGKTPFTLDVRPAALVAAGAIPGTIRIPLSELRARLGELPRDREIWVHCGVGQTSYYAVRLLTQHGFQARNISGGYTSYLAHVSGK
jgi:NADPH-dependent 2,4-dienoyl-CoA reductase/sulfur reductase-like enzyme/rhodanese-related sulfurtransferase